jgi:hypothetical protein
LRFKVYRYVAGGLLAEQETTSSAFFDALLAPRREAIDGFPARSSAMASPGGRSGSDQ